MADHQTDSDIVQNSWRNKTPSEGIFRFIRRVKKNWKSIAGHLQISSESIRILETQYKESPDDFEFDICVHIFRIWLSNNSKERPRTWGELIKVLEKIEINEIAGDMECALKDCTEPIKEPYYYDEVSRNIVLRFVDLTCSLEDVLETDHSIAKVKLYISRLLIAPSQEPCGSTYVVDDPEAFDALRSISSVLSFLKEKKLVSFYNFKIFELFLKEWCSESDVMTEFKQYKKCLKHYAKRYIGKSWLCCEEALQSTVAEGKRLILKTDETWNLEKTFQDVLSLEAEVAKIIGIKEFALVLRRIERVNECLKLHHYIPNVIEVKIQPAEAKMLMNKGIRTVSWGTDQLKELFMKDLGAAFDRDDSEETVITNHRERLVTVITTDLTSFSTAFIQKKYIINDTASDITTATNHGGKTKAAALLDAVLGNLTATNPENKQTWFEGFVAVVSGRGHKDLADSMGKEYKRKKKREHADEHEFNVVPHAGENIKQFAMKCSKASTKYQNHILQVLTTHDDIIAREFFELSSDTQDALVEEHGISVAKLRSHVVRFFLVLTHSKKSTLHNELKSADEIYDIFIILEKKQYMTFLIPDILESIIDRFCKELNSNLERFTKTFNKYIKRRVCDSTLFYREKFLPPDCLDASIEKDGVSTNGEVLILITHDILDAEHNTFEDVIRLLRKVSRILDIPYPYLSLHKIEPNCLTLYHYIPSCFKETVIRLQHDQVARLLCNGLVKEQCGDTTIDLEEKYEKDYLEEYLPAESRMGVLKATWKGYRLTSESIGIELKKAVVTLACDWKFIAQCFNLEKPHIDGLEQLDISDDEKIGRIPNYWLMEKEHFWWELGIILLRCSQQEGRISTIQQQMQHMIQYNKENAPFNIMFLKLILEPIESMEKRLEFFGLLTDKSVDEIDAQTPQFDDSFGEACVQTKYLEHIERNPDEFSWKRIAEALYIHGNNLLLNDLFCLIKSPEVTSLCFDEVKKLLTTHIITDLRANYSKLYAELMYVPPLREDCTDYLMGIKLWLLTSPSRSWEELAWGLYRSYLNNVLVEVKQKHIPEPDDRLTLNNLNYVIEEVELAVDLQDIGSYMEDRGSQNKFQEIEKKNIDPKKQRRIMWEDWHRYYPKVSRVVLYQSLLYIRKHAVARKIVSETFLTNHELSGTPLYESPQTAEITLLPNSSVSIETVLDILLKHIPDRKAYLRLYNELCIEKPSENAIDSDVIKLWLLTTPMCSWRELAWALFVTELDSALVELKKVFIADSSFTPNNIIDVLKGVKDRKTLADLLKHTDMLSKLPNNEEIHVEPDMEVMIKQWHKYHPHASWSVLHQALLRMGEKKTARVLYQKYQLKGYLLAPKHVENILKIFLFRKDQKWEVVGQSFNLSDSDIEDVMKCSTEIDRITKLNECWLKTEENPQWWKVGKSLIKCNAEEANDVQEMMKYIEIWNYNDVPFAMESCWEVVRYIEAWALFFYSLTGSRIYERKPDFKDTIQQREEVLSRYLKDHPAKISWKEIAEAVYHCGEESVLDKLMPYVKSPADPSLNIHTLKTLLEKHSINYASLNAELRVPLLLKRELESSSMIGVKLWLLTNPLCSWQDFAVALYNSHMDDALEELKKQFMPMTDETFSIESVKITVKMVEEWDILGYVIGDRNMQDNFKKIKEVATSKDDQRTMMLTEWHKYHPYASWSLLHQALLNMGMKEVAKYINEKYLKQEEKEIEITAMNCVFSGPPGVGKSTLLERLMGREPKEHPLSTGIFGTKGIVRVDLKPSSSIVTDQEWYEMQEEDEVDAFLTLTILPDIPSSEDTMSDSASQENDSMLTIPVSPTNTSTVDTSALDKSSLTEQSISSTNPSEIPAKKSSTNLSSKESEIVNLGASDIDRNQLPDPIAVLRKAMQHRRQIEATRNLKKRRFLYLTDTGGQREFRELLPLFLPGPTATFIVFNLCNDFHTRTNVKFQPSESTPPVQYKGSSAKEVINEILENIYYSKSKSTVMFVGTHKDKLEQSKMESIIKERNDELGDLLDDCPYYQENIIEKSDGKNLIFCVDNASLNSSHSFVRSAVLGLCKDTKFTVKVKPSWLLFALTLKGMQGVHMSYQYCADIAEKCGIEKEDVKCALRCLHMHMSTLRYYEYKELKSLVIIKPKVLINKLSQLLTKIILKRQSEGALLSHSDIDTVAKERVVFPFEILLNILKYFKVIAPIYETEEGRQYIFPCMLLDGEAISIGPPSAHQLFLSFKINFKFQVPKYLRNAILTSLLQIKEYNVFSPFSKTEISFNVGGLSFQLLLRRKFIVLYPIEQEQLSNQNLSICYNVEETVSKSLLSAVKLLGYSASKPKRGIQCTCNSIKEDHFAEVVYEEGTCSETKKPVKLPTENVWFSQNYYDVQKSYRIVHLKSCSDWVHRRPTREAQQSDCKFQSRRRLWSKEKITVTFLNPDESPPVRITGGAYIRPQDILNIANEWYRVDEKVVPMFVLAKDRVPADIRIKFIGTDEDSWSYVGTEAEEYPMEETMELGLDQNDYESTILHEFGHVLGLDHEHQHPDAPNLLTSDREKLREFFSRKYFPKGTPRAEIDEYIDVQWKRMHRDQDTRTTPYDKDSIMHCLVDEDIRAPDYQGPEEEPSTLSEGDKKAIVELYSKIQKERATMALGEPPEEYVIRSNLISVAQAVQRNLNVISQQLIREAFITAAAADNIIGTLGMPPASKANGFMQCVQSKMSRSHATREQWFEKFVTILANHTAEGELVMKLIRDFVGRKPDYKGHLLTYIQAPQPGSTGAGVTVWDGPEEHKGQIHFLIMSVKPKLSQLALALIGLTWSEMKSMAVQLNMDYSNLQQIQQQNPELSDRLLCSMDSWLKSDPNASWAKIVRALNAISKNVLASELEQKYCQPPTTTATLTQPPTDPSPITSDILPPSPASSSPLPPPSESSLPLSPPSPHLTSDCSLSHHPPPPSDSINPASSPAFTSAPLSSPPRPTPVPRPRRHIRRTSPPPTPPRSTPTPSPQPDSLAGQTLSNSTGAGVLRSEGPEEHKVYRPQQQDSRAMPWKTGKLNLDDDLLKANELLEDLEKDDLRELFKELGLSEKTVKNKYAAATTAYANDLLRNWIIQKDDVLKKGGATWPNLKAALIRKKQAGIAAEIHVQ